MDVHLEEALREICENSAPGTAFGILDKFRNIFGDFEKNNLFIEKLALDHSEKYSTLVPIKNLDQNYDFPLWGVLCRYARVSEESEGNDLKSINQQLFKYIDPSLGIKFLIQASSLEVFDIERLEINKINSNLSQYRRELESEFLDPQILAFIKDKISDETKETFDMKKFDFCDFNIPIRRTVIYDSEILPQLSAEKDAILIIRSSINFKYCNNKTGSWSSEWKFEFPENDSNNELSWKGGINLHCYDSESGNSHLLYRSNNSKIDVLSGNHSRDELLKDPSLFAKESAKMISAYERKIQSKINNSVFKFKNKYIKKLRRILPVNPIKFDWSRFCISIQDPLAGALLSYKNIS